MTTALVLAIVLPAHGAGPSPQSAEPIALAYAASGASTARVDAGPPRKVDDVCRVFAGETLEVPASASLRLAFLDGRRFELRGPARARVTTAGLQAASGSIRELPAVPPLPRLPPVRPEDAGDRIAAIRLRSLVIGILAPPPGDAVLASQELELRFDPVRGAAAYAVEVRGADGKPIAALSPREATARLSAGVLRPGARYSWSVEAVDATGTQYRGLAAFSTLAEDVVAAELAFAKPSRPPTPTSSKPSTASWGSRPRDRSARRPMAASLALGVLLGALLAGPDAGSSGIVVESVVAGSAAEKAGLAPGDRIRSWSQGPDSGPVSSPFDLEDVEIERAPRGPVSLSVVRGDSRLVSLGEDAWGIRARPELPAAELSILDSARAASREGRHGEAAQALAGLAEKATDARVASWLHVESASAWGAGKRWEDAQSRYEAALAGLGPLDAAAVWVKRGGAYESDNSFAGATHAHEEAVRLLEMAGRYDLRYADALRLLTRSLIRAPLHSGRVVSIARRASAIAERLAPDSLTLSLLWANESAMANESGNPALAADLIRKAHAIQKRKAPGTALEANSLISIGMFAAESGDLATAERVNRTAIRILSAVPGTERRLAAAHLNLGQVLSFRGDLEAAEDMTKRCLEIVRDLPASATITALAVFNLAVFAGDRGETTRAEELAEQAVTLFEPVGRRWQAGPLHLLGSLALERGDLDRAEGYFRRSLAVVAETGSGDRRVAEAQLTLGDVARARGAREAAAALYQEVADAHSKWRPGSFEEAQALGRLASLQAEAGRTADAAMLYARAVEALELQRQTLGPGQERGARRMADYSRIYAEYVDVLLSLRRPEEAFRVVEASRARALVELMARRDFDFAADIPPELDREYIADPALAHGEAAKQALAEARAAALERELGSTSLGEEIQPTGNAGLATGNSYLYGIKTFRQAFTPRQRCILLTMAREIRNVHGRMLEAGVEPDRAKSVTTYLGLWLSRITDRFNSLSRWNNAREVVQGITDLKRFAMLWDYPEINIFGGGTGDAWGTLEYMTAVIRKEGQERSPAVCVRASATELPYDAEYFDAVITDPPYYDNESYSELSDICYVWLRPTIGFLYAEHFAGQLTPKKKECVAAAYRQGGKDAARTFYENTLFRSLEEANRVLKPSGILVMVYAHKTTAGWATLVDAIRRAGFQVTEAWPLDTETKSRVAHQGDAALASSIFIAARKRSDGSRGEYEKQVRPALEATVRERVDTLWSLGIAGADLVIACVGAGLRAFTSFAVVEYANGDPVPAERFLQEVESVVLEAILAKLSREAGGDAAEGLAALDPATRFYVLWRYTYGDVELDSGEAIVFANGTHVELDGPDGLAGGPRPLAEKKSDKKADKNKARYRLRDYATRGDDDKLGLPGPTGQAAPVVDVLHRVLWLMEHAPRKVSDFLQQTRANREELRLVAQALAGPALKGGRLGDVSPDAEGAALAKLAANWRGVVEEGLLTPAAKAERRGGQKRLGF